MKAPSRPARSVAAFLFCAIMGAAALGRPSLERTLFKDLPASDPAREVVQAVLGSRLYSMRDGFPAGDWTGLGYGDAWERARRYFPGKVYLVRPGTYFMTHGFDVDGRLFMEVHDSAYLTLCVENRRTFAPGPVVGEYGRMLAASDGREAAAFREKLGRLEASFRDEKSHRNLRQALGEDPYVRLLQALRDEDLHMIAGGLMHEGMHAGLDDALVARIQAEFNCGERAVQWDELRAFTAEIGYHAPFGRWASEDLAGNWRRIEGLFRELEGLRDRPALRTESDRARFERVRARSWAQAALIRLRMREIWQSARRVRDLAVGLREDYIKGAIPSDVEGLLEALDGDSAGFVTAAGEAIQTTETAVRSLEEVLDTWSAWAWGRRPFPPPITDSQAVIRQVERIRWPDPRTDAAKALMKRAGQALEKERAAL